MGLLITLLIYACILAIVWWLVSTLPLPPPFRIIANVVIAIVAIIMLLSLLGGANGFPDLHLGARC